MSNPLADALFGPGGAQQQQHAFGPLGASIGQFLHPVAPPPIPVAKEVPKYVLQQPSTGWYVQYVGPTGTVKKYSVDLADAAKYTLDQAVSMVQRRSRTMQFWNYSDPLVAVPVVRKMVVKWVAV